MLGPPTIMLLSPARLNGQRGRLLLRPEVFGERLLFPREFLGRGDMSRGSLLLRAVRERRELEYGPVMLAA